MKRVIVTEPIHPCGIELLRSEADVVYLPEVPEGRLEDYIGGAEGLAVRVARIGRELIEGAPKLRVIAKHGVGYDNIDVAAATARQVAVVYTPNANITSVAEHILSLMLSMANKVCRADRELRHGAFRTREEYVGVELQGKKLGLIGAGRTGTGAAQRCRAAFGMEVIAYDPYAGWSAIEGQGYRRARELEELLAEADWVAVCVPLGEETRGMIGEEQLRRMKSGAFLVNTARGHIVDEVALEDALRQGQIAGAAMDVFAEEPPHKDHPLLSLDNFVATPHVAGATEESMRRMATELADEVLRVLRGEKPLSCVNPEIYD